MSKEPNEDANEIIHETENNELGWWGKDKRNIYEVKSAKTIKTMTNCHK